MLSGCSQLMWARSHGMWAGGPGYSQPMWARIERCYRAKAFMFSSRHTYVSERTQVLLAVFAASRFAAVSHVGAI